MDKRIVSLARASTPLPIYLSILICLVAHLSLAAVQTACAQHRSSNSIADCGLVGVSAVCVSSPWIDNRTACYGCGVTAGMQCEDDLTGNATLMAVGPGSSVTICGRLDDRLECPMTHPILTAQCGSRTRPCNGSSLTLVNCPILGIYCSRRNTSITMALPIQQYSCDWVPFLANETGVCESASEIVSGVCIGTTQQGCGGTPYLGAVKCCLVRTSSCAPVGSWYSRGSTQCPINTALSGACSVRCDPLALFGTVANNPGMFACGGRRAYTRRAFRYTSGCEQFPSCPAGMVLTSYSQCLSVNFGAGTIIDCQRVAYATVDYTQCTTVETNGNAWCPADQYGVALCAPNLPGPNVCGNFDTKLRCCFLRQYHNMGSTCSPGMAYTGLGTIPTLPAPYGLDNTESIIFSSTGTVSAVAVCNDRLYVTADQGGVVYGANMKQDRGNVSVGQFGNRGFDRPTWQPGTWSYPTGRLSSPTAVAIQTCRSSGETVLVVDSGSFLVRNFRQDAPLGPTSPVNFLSDRVVGANRTTPSLFVNDTWVHNGTMNTLNFAVFRMASNEVLVSTVMAVVACSYQTSFARYYIGDGITPGGFVTGIFRTNAKLFNPRQMAILDDVILYMADWDGVSVSGVLHVTDLGTGLVYDLNVIPVGTVPFGLVLYERMTMFLSDRDRHCIWRVDLTTYSTTLFAGQCGVSGFQDRVPALSALFNSPRFLAASSTQLFVADYGNSRVRFVTVTDDSCGDAYNPLSTNCSLCAIGFFGWPRCRPGCLSGDDCGYRATSITGTVGNCQCTCQAGFWARWNCTACNRGRDLATDCATCQRNHQRFPTCRTESVSRTPLISETESMRLTDTFTITPPPTDTQTLTISATSVQSDSLTLTLSMSFTDLISKSMDVTPTAGRTVTGRPTDTESATLILTDTGTWSYLPTSTLSARQTETVSWTATLTSSLTHLPSASDSLSATLSSSLTEEFSSSETRSKLRTPSSTQSWPLLPPTIGIDLSLSPSLRTTVTAADGTTTDGIKADIFRQPLPTGRTVYIRVSFGDWELSEVSAPTAAPASDPTDGELSTPSMAWRLQQAAKLCILRVWTPYQPLQRVFDRQNFSLVSLPTFPNLKVLPILFPQDSSYPLYAEPSEISGFNAETVPNRLLYVNFSAKCFNGKRAPRAPLLLRIMPFPPEPFVPAAALNTGTALAFVTSISTFLWPSAVLLQFPLLFFNRLAEARFGSVPWQYHLLQIRLGDPDEEMLLGAAVCNSSMLLLVLLIHFGVSQFLSERRDEPILTGMARARFPGYWFSFYAYMVFPTVSCITALVTMQKYVAFAFVIPWVAMLVLVVVLCLKTPGGFNGKYIKHSILDIPLGLKKYFFPLGRWVDVGAQARSPGAQAKLQKRATGRGYFSERGVGVDEELEDEEDDEDDEAEVEPESSPDDVQAMAAGLPNPFCRRLGPLFQDFRPQKRFVFPGELILVALFGVLDGLLMGLGKLDQVNNTVMIVLSTLALAFSLAMGGLAVQFPRLVLFESLVFVIVSGLELITALLCLGAYGTGNAADGVAPSLRQAASILVTIAFFLLFVLILRPIVQWVLPAVQQYRQQNRGRRDDESDSDDDDNGNEKGTPKGKLKEDADQRMTEMGQPLLFYVPSLGQHVTRKELERGDPVQGSPFPALTRQQESNPLMDGSSFFSESTQLGHRPLAPYGPYGRPNYGDPLTSFQGGEVPRPIVQRQSSEPRLKRKEVSFAFQDGVMPSPIAPDASRSWSALEPLYSSPEVRQTQRESDQDALDEILSRHFTH